MRPRSRSWRFRVPRLDAPPGEPVGLVVDPAGAIDTVADDEAIRQSLLMLISTRPGERVMRPEYGCDLHRLVFSPNDDTTAGLAIHFVRQAVERWEPAFLAFTAKGTAAVTRVLIDSTDGERTWSTIGVSENIIEASWEALVDSLEYAFQPKDAQAPAPMEAAPVAADR